MTLYVNEYIYIVDSSTIIYYYIRIVTHKNLGRYFLMTVAHGNGSAPMVEVAAAGCAPRKSLSQCLLCFDPSSSRLFL